MVAWRRSARRVDPPSGAFSPHADTALCSPHAIQEVSGMSAMGDALDKFAEVETGEAFTLQNPYLLKSERSETTVMARNGAMVAYQGDVRCAHKGGGVGRLLKKAATGESL